MSKMEKDEIYKILQLVMQAKEEAGEPVYSAMIMTEDEVEHIDNSADAQAATERRKKLEDEFENSTLPTSSTPN